MLELEHHGALAPAAGLLSPPAPVIAMPFWRRADVRVCAASFIVLVAWLLIFPYTADGDSVLHYLNAREAYLNPAACLHPWARPAFKLFLAWFAIHGITAARLFMATIGTAVVWQTIRLAEDLQLPRACLAGAMVLWQPFAFAVAADTMSEMPMALALVLAIRCWTNGWLTWSCLIAGFLPSLRPEGFFFGIIWGVMALHHVWRTRRGWLLLPALAVGLLAWIGACVYWTGDWLHVYHVWDWPRKTYEGYGRGSIFHYVIWWPVYCGGPMTVLFLAGLRPSWCKAMRLPWVAFGAVFGVHSILYWGGWFCSCGLLRILACVAPITALVALHGWNRLADLLRQRGEWNAPRLRRAGIVVALIATVWTLAHYCLDRSHYDCFPLLRCTAYVRDHQLLHADTWFFSGNQIADADLDLPPRRPHVMDSPCDPPKIARLLAKLPVGAIGIWDDRQAPIWHGHTIEDLAGHGFTILYETSERHLGRELRYAVLRKDGAFTPKHK